MEVIYAFFGLLMFILSVIMIVKFFAIAKNVEIMCRDIHELKEKSCSKESNKQSKPVASEQVNDGDLNELNKETTNDELTESQSDSSDNFAIIAVIVIAIFLIMSLVVINTSLI